MTLDLGLVRHALALAQHGNFRRAAHALHVSQPTLSRSIAALEASLGVRLFDRTSHGAVPTVFGQLVLDRGRDLLAREADLLQEISMRAGLASGGLVVSAGPNPFEISVVDALTRLIAQHPGLDVQASVMHAVDVVRDVLAGVADVGVADRSVAQNQDRLLVQPLPEHPVYLACRPGHPLAGKRDLTPEEIDRFPLAATHVIGHAARYMAMVGARGSKYDPNTGQYRAAIHVNSYAVSRQIASGTDAITPGTAKMLAADVGSGRLVTLDFRAPELRTGYCLLLLKDRMRSPSAAKFIELLREVEAEVATAESRQ